MTLKGIVRRVRRHAQGKVLRTKAYGRLRLGGLHFRTKLGSRIDVASVIARYPKSFTKPLGLNRRIEVIGLLTTAFPNRVAVHHG